jgi:hypothetical protein
MHEMFEELKIIAVFQGNISVPGIFLIHRN